MGNYSILPTGEENFPLTHFAMARMIGLPEVTERNWRKVYARAVQVQGAQGPGVMGVTPELVRRHIGQGLGPFQLSDAAFRKQLAELFEGRIARELAQWEASQSTDAETAR